MLAPILRSDTQGRLLAEVFLDPSRERTATDLARASETSLPDASRELSRLVDRGYLTSRQSGRNRYLRANEMHPLFRPVSEIVLYANGPTTVLSQALATVHGVSEAYIYGSWAARLSDVGGPDPRDIDLLVIGNDIDRNELDMAAESARRRLGREVNPHAVTRKAWDGKSDISLRHVSEGATVRIPLAAGDR